MDIVLPEKGSKQSVGYLAANREGQFEEEKRKYELGRFIQIRFAEKITFHIREKKEHVFFSFEKAIFICNDKITKRRGISVFTFTFFIKL